MINRIQFLCGPSGEYLENCLYETLVAQRRFGDNAHETDCGPCGIPQRSCGETFCSHISQKLVVGKLFCDVIGIKTKGSTDDISAGSTLQVIFHIRNPDAIGK